MRRGPSPSFGRASLRAAFAGVVGDVGVGHWQRGGKLLLTTSEEAVMRKVLTTAVFAVVALAMLAPPVLAQAPAPKVTITGLFDQVTSFGKNYNDGNASRDSDHEWYARTRFRPDFKFEVGRTKAVMGLEIDITYGRIGQQTGG